MNNPLLDFSDLPRFEAITPAHVEPAITSLLEGARAAQAKATAADFPAEWPALAQTLAVATERLTRAWGVVGHLSAVADTPELRAAHNAMLPAVTEFSTQLACDERLFAKYKAMSEAGLSPEQARARTNALRDFVLGGADLEGAAKAEFAKLAERMAELGQKFSENALDATDRWAYFAPSSELAGVPQDVQDATRAAAQEAGQDGHKLTLKLPCYLPVMQFAQNRALRERMYRAYVTRASTLADGELADLDNSGNMAEQITTRQAKAALLGHPNFAAVSMASKMADSPAEVEQFLRDLAARAKPKALQDLADMRAFAAEHLAITDPQSWDWPFIGERVKEARYSYSEQEVKQYFTAPKVIAGLFKIVETLFEVEIREAKTSTWHESVQFFRIERQGQLLAQFYLDQPARDGKRGGAWMDICRDRWVRPDTGALQTPVAYLVCNFAAGVGGKPALLTHDDVITLFHEFGHGLHLMLTQVDERDVGMGAVEWDAIELPSQFMENFCWDWQVLRHMTAHVETGQPMPEALFAKLLAAKNYQTGLQTLRQIEFGLYDLLMHTDASKATDLAAHGQAVSGEVGVLSPPAYFRNNTFNHLFGSGGGYAAGYYSYKWAELLSSDAYAAFEETQASDGSYDVNVGRKYRQEILEVGGKRPAMESFKAFRGRAPSIDALLRHQGLVS